MKLFESILKQIKMRFLFVKIFNFIEFMVLEAGDPKKTQEDIDFMLINGLIIV